MKISKSKLKRIIKEELEEARLMDPSTRGKRKVAVGWAHKGDISPEEAERRDQEVRIYQRGMEDGINGDKPDHAFAAMMSEEPIYGPALAKAYFKGYESGLDASRKGEAELTPYEAELAGLEEPNIGTRMGPYKHSYAAAPPTSGPPPRRMRVVPESKITKSQLKQIIKEELEGLIGEAPGDAASIKKAQKLPAIEEILYKNIKGLLYNEATALAEEIYRLSGGDDNESARIAAMIAQRIVKVAGDVTDYRKRKLAVNDALKALKGAKSKPQGGAEKSQTTSSKPTQHHRKMKLDSLRQQFMAAKSKERATRANIPALREIYDEYIRLGGRAEDLGVKVKK